MKKIERRPIIDISDLNTVQQPSNKHEKEKTQSLKKRDQRQNRVTIGTAMVMCMFMELQLQHVCIKKHFSIQHSLLKTNREWRI